MLATTLVFFLAVMLVGLVPFKQILNQRTAVSGAEDRLTALEHANEQLEGEIDAEVETTKRPQADPTALLANRFWERFPGQAEARLREGYTGVYDCTPDFQPALGPVQAVPGLYIAAGYSGHGFKLSPAV